MSTRLHIVVSEGLLARIDAAKGVGQPRADWIRRAVEQALGEAKEPLSGSRPTPGSVPSSEGVRSAAPAEQPDLEERLREEAERYGPALRALAEDQPSAALAREIKRNNEQVRSSVQAKRDVAPSRSEARRRERPYDLLRVRRG